MFLVVLAVIGLGLAVRSLRKRLTAVMAMQVTLTEQLLQLREGQEQLAREWRSSQAAATAAQPQPQPEPQPQPPAQPEAPPQLHPPPVQPSATTAGNMEWPEEQPAFPATAPPPPATPPAPPPLLPPLGSAAAESVAAASRSLIEFFTTGNVVAKVGVVILFFGVAFLLRYAAERGMLPIEYRLMGTAVAALVLLGIGWRLRHSRRDYSIVLQGGAVGLLYLTIFAAYRLYDLLPATLTFGLLLGTVAFSGVLAVVQNAMALAVLGTSGGFLAPILASTGGGSHVGLFSYYVALNLGVLGIAWFRAWRFLNWLAFVFTFGIGFVWGQAFYQPSFFSTTEPFLVLFFLLFLTVSILSAASVASRRSLPARTAPSNVEEEPGIHHEPPLLRGYVDGSLVFGLPAIAFGMQSVLVADIPFGRAYSAVALCALYLGLARALWRRDQTLRPLAEAFLGLAVVFLVLAVPLAFDGHATAAAWALEGAALVWLGVRQRRLLARIGGAALLLGAGVAFAMLATPRTSDLAVLNTRFLGCAAIAAGSIAAGLWLSRAREIIARPERALEWVLLAWGLLWWFGAVAFEVGDHTPRTELFVSWWLLVASASGCLFAWLGRRWQWRSMMQAMIPIGPLLWLWVLPILVFGADEGPLPDLGWLAWPAVLASSYLLVFWFDVVWPRIIVYAWHMAVGWLAIFLVTWTLAVAVRDAVPDTPTWSSTVWCLVPVLFVLTLGRLRQRLTWPMQRFNVLYSVFVPIAPVAGMLVWVLWSCGQDGSAAPLPYVPLLNPLEVTQALALITSYAWWRRHVAHHISDPAFSIAYNALIAVFAFVALNMVVGRMVHFYGGVAFETETLAASSAFQTGISILWGITAGALMNVARRRRERPMWLVGAGLLAALIAKLFLVDLGDVDGIGRIVSFIATGVLILLIAYFAPAPPRSAAAAEPTP